MANTAAGDTRTIDRITFWILVHASTSGLWEDCEANGGIPRDDRIQTAYEALGILHAQSHAELEAHGSVPYLRSCPIDSTNVAPFKLVEGPQEPSS